jgi:hypothetical protein
VTVTAYFFDEDDARAVAARLRAGGFAAEIGRGRFAGEDDDEGQPWVLSTDAPALHVEVVAEDAGGWVDDHEEPDAAPRLSALPLPDRPIRPSDG